MAKEQPGLENSKVGESQNVTQKCGASLFIGIKNLSTLKDMPFSNAFQIQMKIHAAWQPT